jgi:hypothetical protein
VPSVLKACIGLWPWTCLVEGNSIRSTVRLTGASKNTVYDVTIVGLGKFGATLGVLLAGFALVRKRGKIIEEFVKALDGAKAQFTRDLRDKLSADLRGIHGVIDEKFAGLDVLLESQQNDLQPKLKLAEFQDRRFGLAESHRLTAI